MAYNQDDDPNEGPVVVRRPVYDAGMKALFLAHRQSDPMGFIVGAEIYDHLEKVVDRFEDVANGIAGVLIEHL